MSLTRDLTRLIREKPPLQKCFSDVNEWGQKVLNLLSVHRIVTHEGRQTFVTFLEDSSRGGQVNVVLGEAPEV